MMKLYVKSMDTNYYATAFVDYPVYTGEIININGKRFVIIGGDCIRR